MAKMKVLRKTAKWHRMGAKGQETGSDSAESHETELFCHFWILFDFIMQKKLTRKAFVEGGLISLTLRTRTVF